MTERKLKDTIWDKYKEVLKNRLIERLNLKDKDKERFIEYFDEKGEKVFRTIIEIAVLILENKLSGVNQGLHVSSDQCPFDELVLFDKILQGE